MNRHLNVLIVMKEKFHNAPRPLRFYSHCKAQKYEVSVACSLSKQDEFNQIRPVAEISNPQINKYQRIALKLFRKVVPLNSLKNRINKIIYDLDNLEELLKKKEYDIIYVADLHMLPLVLKYKKKSKVIFDAREYYPLQYEDSLNFVLFEKNECIRILNQTLHLCDKVWTVSKGLAEAYRKNFGVSPELVYSVPNYQEERISNTSEETVKILYHGVANRNRKIENYIDVLDLLTIDAELHLYLVGDGKYIGELQKCSIDKPRVFFHKPVAFHEIVTTVNNYDIGICYYEPTSFNLKHCLPNKFFEYIQARLVVAIGPSPDMAEIIREFECGIISEDFSVQSLAIELNSLSRSKINRMKRNSDHASRRLCFQNEEIKYFNTINELVN